jgi:hypothetical protein
MPYPTSDLCRVKALKRVLAHPIASGNCAVLQVFYEICLDGSSIAYAPVLARLQYTRRATKGAQSPGIQTMVGRRQLHTLHFRVWTAKRGHSKT